MVIEKEKSFFDFIKLVSPGMPLRTVVNDLVESGLGAIIVFDSPELHEQNLFEGGFRINCRFTQQKLFELCKMDGGIIVSTDLSRILYANVLMTPDNSLHTHETGTRHKAAERIAKQAKTFVIAVSERKRKTTLYYSKTRYYLKTVDELIRGISSILQVLEKQREIFDDLLNNLNILEMSELVSVSDVCKVIQRAEMILKISDTIKKNFTELGKEGSIMQMRYRELVRGIEKIENEVLRDYSIISLKKSTTLLSNLTYDGLLDIESISRLIIEKPLEESISPKGFRFLSHLTLAEKEISQIVKQFGNLRNILISDSSNFENILKGRASKMKEEILNLKEQVLSGKVVC
ncbi:MAG: DNA integrity scanning diadenylate cyclase DisA [Candidatus Pacearchaeota archaeon]